MLAILDYEAGNQTSVLRGLASQGIPARITADAGELARASGVIFPGVGAAGQAMDLLTRTGLDTVLKDLARQGKPLLGVCLGCQILLERSEEADTQTLGLIKGRCVRFDPALRDEAGDPVCIPHMGWNGYSLKKPSLLIYLQAPVATLVDRIQKRARSIEESIDPGYLQLLESYYQQWLPHYSDSPLLTVGSASFDFVNTPDHLDQIVSAIEYCLSTRKNLELKVPVHKNIKTSKGSCQVK